LLCETSKQAVDLSAYPVPGTGITEILDKESSIAENLTSRHHTEAASVILST
jgi:hypothetical protein